MAFISKQEVQAKSIALKEINKKYGVKATFSGSNSSKLNLTVRSGAVDFIGNFLKCSEHNSRLNTRDAQAMQNYVRENKCIDVNHYYMDEYFNGTALAYLEEVYALMLEGHYDESDAQTDYFNCAWYNGISIGSWNKPYELTA
jgi:hypothetical protein